MNIFFTFHPFPQLVFCSLLSLTLAGKNGKVSLDLGNGVREFGNVTKGEKPAFTFVKTPKTPQPREAELQSKRMFFDIVRLNTIWLRNRFSHCSCKIFLKATKNIKLS